MVIPENTDWYELGRQAYIGYGQAVMWVNHLGFPMTSFEHLDKRIQDGWIAAAKEVVRVTKNVEGF